MASQRRSVSAIFLDWSEEESEDGSSIASSHSSTGPMRVLSCGHALNEDSIQRLKSKKNWTKVICPVCQSETTIEGQGIDKLPLDINNTNLYRMVRDENISYRNHLVLQMATEQPAVGGINLKTEVDMNDPSSWCSCRHRQEVQHFCEDCHDYICDRCCKLEHLWHKVRSLKDMSGPRRSQIGCGLSTLEEYVKELVYIQEQLGLHEHNSNKTYEETKALILQQGETVKQLVDQTCQDLIAEVNKIRYENEKIIHEKKLEIHKKLGELGNHKERANKILIGGTDKAVLDEAKSLNEKLESFHLLPPPAYKYRINYIRPEVCLEDLNPLLGRLKLIKIEWGGKADKLCKEGYQKEIWNHSYTKPIKMTERPLPTLPPDARAGLRDTTKARAAPPSPTSPTANNGVKNLRTHHEKIYDTIQDSSEYLMPSPLRRPQRKSAPELARSVSPESPDTPERVKRSPWVNVLKRTSEISLPDILTSTDSTA